LLDVDNRNRGLLALLLISDPLVFAQSCHYIDAAEDGTMPEWRQTQKGGGMVSSEFSPGLFQTFDYADGKDTLRSLHLIWQIVGKVRMKLFPTRESYQHVTLFTDSRGFTTRPIPYRGIAFEVAIDMVDSVCRVVTSDGRSSVVPLQTPIATFYQSFVDALASLKLDVPMKPEPYDIPGETTPFPADTRHRDFDARTARSIWQIYLGINMVLEDLASGFRGKVTYPQFYWHHIDISSYRFYRPDHSTPEQSISSGFWIGDDSVGEPMLFSYLYPTPGELSADASLVPASAFWGDNHMALLRYNAVADSPDPYKSCQSFYQSAVAIFAETGNWDST
jgi:hypothetical protein